MSVLSPKLIVKIFTSLTYPQPINTYGFTKTIETNNIFARAQKYRKTLQKHTNFPALFLKQIITTFLPINAHLPNIPPRFELGLNTLLFFHLVYD